MNEWMMNNMTLWIWLLAPNDLIWLRLKIHATCLQGEYRSDREPSFIHRMLSIPRHSSNRGVGEGLNPSIPPTKIIIYIDFNLRK